jgi:NOL1/NOP2/fmu family ribosome biogenesis protein
MRIPLNSKARKQLMQVLFEHYGYPTETSQIPYAFMLHTKEMKLFCISLDVAHVPIEDLRINSMGLYFGEYSDNQDEIRLTIEGSQMIGPHATKNVVTLTDEEIKVWLTGQPFAITDALAGQLSNVDSYMLIKNNKGDFFGSGRIKGSEILNFVPKIRRVVVDE